MTKERLRRYQAIKAEQRQLQSLLDEIEAPMYGPKAQQLSGMPFPPSRIGSGSPQEQMADRTMELRARYAGKIEELHAEQLEIETAIDKLEPKQRTLLRHRYIEGMTWEEVCICMGYSWRQTHRLHADALEQLREPGE